MLFICACCACAQAQTPIAGHYPPGQSGIRGAITPLPGFSYTNFSRFFSNLEVLDASGTVTREVEEVRYANISMFTFTSDAQVLGMTYGALAGVPFSTGNIHPSAEDVGSRSFGLGDILITPLSLYGKSTAFDYQFQFTVWTPSGKFVPGGPDNRGTGYWALIYSLGGVYFPGENRAEWSLSAVARIEQNFEQKESGITPGDDIVIDWGIGKIFETGAGVIDAGISGFATWQFTRETGNKASVDSSAYYYFGIGPEASLSASESLTLRLRAQWEFSAHNAVQGNNLWFIINYRF